MRADVTNCANLRYANWLTELSKPWRGEMVDRAGELGRGGGESTYSRHQHRPHFLLPSPLSLLTQLSQLFPSNLHLSLTSHPASDVPPCHFRHSSHSSTFSTLPASCSPRLPTRPLLIPSHSSNLQRLPTKKAGLKVGVPREF